MTEKHSKLLWKMDGFRIYSADGKIITGVDDNGRTETFPNDWDVEFIVKACNMHTELVEALKKIRDMMPKDDGDYYDGWAYECRVIAEEALKATKEG